MSGWGLGLALVIGAAVTAVYAILKWDPANGDAFVYSLLLIFGQTFGAVSALDLLVFLYKPAVRKDRLLQGRASALILAVASIAVFAIARTAIMLFSA